MKYSLLIFAYILLISSASGQGKEIALKQFDKVHLPFIYTDTDIQEMGTGKTAGNVNTDSFSRTIPEKSISFPFGYYNYSVIPGSSITIKKTAYYHLHYKMRINTHNDMIASCSSDFYLSIFINGRIQISHLHLLSSAVTDATLEGETSYLLNKDDVIDLRGSTNVSFWQLNRNTAQDNIFVIKITAE